MFDVIEDVYQSSATEVTAGDSPLDEVRFSREARLLLQRLGEALAA